MTRTWIVVAVALLAGCGSIQPEVPKAGELAAAKGSGRTYEAFARAVADGESAWARRAEGAEAVRAAVKAWERAYAIDPNDRHVCQRLALSLYYVANYFSKDDAEKEKEHQRGYNYGVAAALLNPKIRDAFEKGTRLEEALAANATPGDVPGIYWMMVNLARVAEMKSIAVQASTAPRLKIVAETIYRIGPEYYWGGVNRFLGAYYVKAPAQKDPLAQSKREFDRAITPENALNLENYVLYAEYYAVAAQDKAVFEKLLGTVLASDPAKDDPALRLDNAEARKRAKKMLETEDDRF